MQLSNARRDLEDMFCHERYYDTMRDFQIDVYMPTANMRYEDQAVFGLVVASEDD